MRGEMFGWRFQPTRFSHREGRSILGMTDRGLSAKVIDSDTAKTLGHQLVLTVTSGETGETISRIDAFQEEVEFQGTIYPEGTTLVAIQEGLGLKRNTHSCAALGSLSQRLVQRIQLSGVPVSRWSPATLVMTRTGHRG